MIEIENVWKSYRTGFWKRRFVALENYTLTIRKGELHGLVGSNGAGKTTLMKMITGISRPDRGHLRIGGVSVEEREARTKIGFMTEHTYTYEFMTGNEYLMLMGTLAGMTVEDCRKRIPETLALVGLAEAGGREIRKYSKGMRQRVNLAQALLHDPEVLILDEPMSGLDPRGRHELRGIISGLSARGKTVLFSTHILDDVEKLCTHVQVVEKGKLKWFGPMPELFGSEQSMQRVEEIVYGVR